MHNKISLTVALLLLVVLNTGCGVEEPSPDLPVPDTDVQGTDLQGIPRYPDSTRIDYKTDDETEQKTVTYLTDDGFREIEEFYKQRLQEEGWENIRSYSTPGTVRSVFGREGQMQLSATKDDTHFIMEGKPSPTYADTVEITLSLYPK